VGSFKRRKPRIIVRCYCDRRIALDQVSVPNLPILIARFRQQLELRESAEGVIE
jgi:hypothetical protein